MTDCPIPEQALRLEERLKALRPAIVAFSGGVDSSLLAYAAHLALGNDMLAVIGDSASLARRELQAAQDFCRIHGIPLRVANPAEMQDPCYLANRPDRCYHCKTRLFESLAAIGKDLGQDSSKAWNILDGSNADDRSDYRPGLEAAHEKGVVSPFIELGLGKNGVRELCRHYRLGVADKPASPCLSSRIPYGEQVNSGKLGSIEHAEDFLLGLGFSPCRVRHHGSVARVEVAEKDLPRALSLRKELCSGLRKCGFVHVALDLDGFRSGSMNEGISRS